MNHLALRSLTAAVLGLLVATPAFAHQCPKLVAQIDAAVGNRFDPAAAEARTEAAQAMALHQQGKHDQAEAVAKDALTKIGKKM